MLQNIPRFEHPEARPSRMPMSPTRLRSRLNIELKKQSVPGNIALLSRRLLADLLGSVIDFERERLNWAAGLRTHMLVCVGSSLIMRGKEKAGRKRPAFFSTGAYAYASR